MLVSVLTAVEQSGAGCSVSELNKRTEPGSADYCQLRLTELASVVCTFIG